MLKKNIFLIIVFTVMFFSENIYSQITTSPYTFFGAGQIEDNGFGINRAMGGTGIAFQAGTYLNNANPASYTGMRKHSFLFEFGMFGRYTAFKTHSETQKKINANIRYIAGGWRANKFWAISFGLVPYSSVGYEINSETPLEGSKKSYTKTYKGEGGINQVYWANSVDLFKGLSVGVNMSYLWGTIQQAEKGDLSIIDSYYEIENKNQIHNFYIDYGLQYTYTTENWKYSFGAIYGSETKLSTSRESYIYTSDATSEIEETTKDDKPFYIPEKYGLGLAIAKRNKFRLGLDYERKNWSTVDFANPMLKTRNSDKYSIGFEYIPDIALKRFSFKNMVYRCGLSYNSSYLKINNEPINTMSASWGIGIPIRKSMNICNISFEYGQTGTTQKGLIKEEYYQVHINFTLHDLWFQRTKFF